MLFVFISVRDLHYKEKPDNHGLLLTLVDHTLHRLEAFQFSTLHSVYVASSLARLKNYRPYEHLKIISFFI